MPPLEVDDLYQTAVLWTALGLDQFSNRIVASPIEIQVRSEKGKKNINPAGDVITYDAIVAVDRVIKPDSLMFLGSLTYFVGTGSIGDETELYEVADNMEIPDLKARSIRRTVGLNRFRGTLPEMGV